MRSEDHPKGLLSSEEAEHAALLGQLRLIYRKSQSLIFNTDAPQFVGAGKGTDNLEFMAGLSTLEVINPDAVEKDKHQQEMGPIPESPAVLLNLLNGEHIPYAHYAWCTEYIKTMSQLKKIITFPITGWCCNHHVLATVSLSDNHGNGIAAQAVQLRIILQRPSVIEMGYGL